MATNGDTCPGFDGEPCDRRKVAAGYCRRHRAAYMRWWRASRRRDPLGADALSRVRSALRRLPAAMRADVLERLSVPVTLHDL